MYEQRKNKTRSQRRRKNVKGKATQYEHGNILQKIDFKKVQNRVGETARKE